MIFLKCVYTFKKKILFLVLSANVCTIHHQTLTDYRGNPDLGITIHRQCVRCLENDCPSDK